MTTATAAAESDFELVLERVFDASLDRVWAAWTNADALVQWFFPHDCQLGESVFDIVEGGAYRCTLMGCTSGKHFTMRGTYEEIKPQYRLVFTHGWVGEGDLVERMTRIVVTFVEEEQGRTRLNFCQSGLGSEEARNSHADGWGGVLDHLGDHVA